MSLQIKPTITIYESSLEYTEKFKSIKRNGVRNYSVQCSNVNGRPFGYLCVTFSNSKDIFKSKMIFWVNWTFAYIFLKKIKRKN